MLIEIRRIINIYQQLLYILILQPRDDRHRTRACEARNACVPADLMRKGLKKTVDAGEILHQLMVLSCFIPLVEHVELKP